MSLHLHPWFTVRAVTGTSSFADAEELLDPWDNLRGAAFSGTLDNRWHIRGSLEEMQAIPSMQQLFWMGDWSDRTHWNSLPGWGQSKVTTTGRVDAARAGVQSNYSLPMFQIDTLTVKIAYDAASWGFGPHRTLMDPEAPSFPHAGVTYAHKELLVSAIAARWLGRDKAPREEWTSPLARRFNAGWISAQHTWGRMWSVGGLVGGSQMLPWTEELLPDSLASIQPFGSIYSQWALGSHQLRCEWSPGLGWTGSWAWSVDETWFLDVWLTGALTKTPVAIQNMGVPLGTPLVPTWWEDSPPNMTWIGMRAAWKNGAWQAQLKSQMAHQNLFVDAEIVRELIATWPLYLSLSAETWAWRAHPMAPLQGNRLRIGVTHRPCR
jgi:hypothetical protein